MTCQNIESNKMVLDEFSCQIPTMYQGKHLENFIPKDIAICSDEITKDAIDMIRRKISNCSRGPTCEMTRFTFIFNEAESYEKNVDLVWIYFSNPEVLNYKTYISYDLLSLIGEIGGILGLTLGVSALTFFELLLHRISYY